MHGGEKKGLLSTVCGVDFIVSKKRAEKRGGVDKIR